MHEQQYRSPVVGGDDKAMRDAMLGLDTSTRNIVQRAVAERMETKSMIGAEARLPAAMVFIDSLGSTLSELQDLSRLIDVKLDPIMRRVPTKDNECSEKIHSEMPPFFEHVTSQLRMMNNEIRSIRRYIESVEF